MSVKKPGFAIHFSHIAALRRQKGPILRLTANDKIFDECEIGFDEWEFPGMGI